MTGIASLHSKTAFVTGGGQGIGRGIAIELAKAGAGVIIAGRNVDTTNQVVTEIQALGRQAFALKIDVTDERSINQCVDRALAIFPRIDILVNNAGVMQSGLYEAVTTADLELCYQVNVKGIWSVSRALIPHFKGNGAGKIINIASTAARRGDKSAGAYCASKAAAISLTQAFADELGPHNINVNAVCPGTTWTPMWEALEEKLSHGGREQALAQRRAFQAAVACTPLKRPITPEDIGHAVVFLASEQARNITGQAINVCGGEVMN